MPRRFFVDQPIQGEYLLLTGHEAHHLAQVVRLAKNDSLILFDGSGSEFTANIEKIQKKQVLLRITSCCTPDREIAMTLKIAVPLPKGDRQKMLVEKLVELGVHELIPLRTRRSVVVASAKTADKLDRRVIEACKQSGRNRLMTISQPRHLDDLVAQSDIADFKFIAHPGTLPLRNPIEFPKPQRRPSVIVAIGPEGGFVDDELAMARHYCWQQLTVAKTILRVETAALVAATLFGILPELDPRILADHFRNTV